jgi:hypothetical protein
VSAEVGAQLSRSLNRTRCRLSVIVSGSKLRRPRFLPHRRSARPRHWHFELYSSIFLRGRRSKKPLCGAPSPAAGAFLSTHFEVRALSIERAAELVEERVRRVALRGRDFRKSASTSDRNRVASTPPGTGGVAQRIIKTRSASPTGRRDPVYFSRPLINTTDFKKVANTAGWNPSPCTTK